jgi:hypothetical protein
MIACKPGAHGSSHSRPATPCPGRALLPHPPWACGPARHIRPPCNPAHWARPARHQARRARNPARRARPYISLAMTRFPLPGDVILRLRMECEFVAPFERRSCGGSGHGPWPMGTVPFMRSLRFAPSTSGAASAGPSPYMSATMPHASCLMPHAEDVRAVCDLRGGPWPPSSRVAHRAPAPATRLASSSGCPPKAPLHHTALRSRVGTPLGRECQLRPPHDAYPKGRACNEAQ